MIPHSWEVIPFYLIYSYLGKYFKFRSNLYTKIGNMKHFPIYYKLIFNGCENGVKIYLSVPSLSSTIASQVIWYKNTSE